MVKTQKQKKNVKSTPTDAAKAVKRLAKLEKQMERMAITSSPTFRDIFGQLGHKLGNLAGSGLSRFADTIFGEGAYRMKGGNTLWDTTSQVPIMHGTANQIRIRNREYLGDLISSSSAGSVQVAQFVCNPGYVSSFPWLSQIAAEFQEYHFDGLVYTLHSTSGTAVNSTNTALGTWGLAFQYRSDAPVPTSKAALTNEFWSCDARVTDDVHMPVEVAANQSPMKNLYVRNTTLASSQDAKLYDLGRLIAWSQGCQGTSVNLGEVWVSYDIVFEKPVSPQAGLYGLPLGVHISTSGTIDSTNTLGTSQTIKYSTFDPSLLVITNNSVVIPATFAGDFMAIVMWYSAGGASVTTDTINVTSGTDGNGMKTATPTVLNIIENDITYGTNTTNTTNVWTVAVLALSTTGGGKLQFTTGAITGTITTADVFLVPLPGGNTTSTLLT